MKFLKSIHYLNDVKGKSVYGNNINMCVEGTYLN